MSIRRVNSRTREDKLELLDVELSEIRHDSAAISPRLEPISRQNSFEPSNGFLAAPLSVPIRPLSPDTLSNLSADEYEQIAPGCAQDLAARDRRSSVLSDTTSASGWRARCQQFWIRNKGLAFMLLAQIFGVLMNVTTRLLEVEGNKGKGLHPFQILFVRMGITTILASTYMWHQKTPHFPLGMPEVRGLLVVRGLAGFGGVFGMYFSLLYLPLADATVITFLSPGLACWACSILIKEPFTRIEQIGTLVSLVGVILIARPVTLFAGLIGGGGNVPASGEADSPPSPSDSDASNYENVTPIQRLTAVGIALIGVLGSAAAYTVIRWIGKRAHPLISVNYFATWCFIVSIVMQSVLPDVGFVLPAAPKEWGYLFFLGTCGFTMQFLMAAALSYEKSSRITNMAYTSMLFALGFDKLIFGHTPDLMSILGSSLILGSAIIVAVQRAPPAGDKDAGRDDESRVGLMGDVERGEDPDRDRDRDPAGLPVQEVQMRTLR